MTNSLSLGRAQRAEKRCHPSGTVRDHTQARVQTYAMGRGATVNTPYWKSGAEKTPALLQLLETSQGAYPPQYTTQTLDYSSSPVGLLLWTSCLGPQQAKLLNTNPLLAVLPSTTDTWWFLSMWEEIHDTRSIANKA